MSKSRRILLEASVQPAVLGPIPRTELGHYFFGDGEPARGDIIEWDDGKIYVIAAKLWPQQGDPAVIVHEI